MVYSDTSGLQGIVEEIDFIVNTNSSSYPITQKTRNINRGLDKVAYLIQTADGKWDFEDTNNTDLPIGYTDLVAGQQDYSFDSTHLKIKNVFYVDKEGTKTELIHRDDKAFFLEKISTQDIGIPTAYCIIGNSIFLDCFPEEGTIEDANIQLEVYFARNVSYFAVSDTTKTPGFNPQFHRILSLYGAYDYAFAKGLESTKLIRQEIALMEKSIQDFYSKRDQTQNIRMRVEGLCKNDYI